MKKWTTKQYKEYVEKYHKDEFEVIGEYINNNSNILMKHRDCGREFNIRPANFKTRGNCPLCKGNFRKTNEQFIREVESKTEDYLVVGEYLNAKTKITFNHIECGREFGMTPDDFINGGNRCPHCARNRKKTHSEFHDEIKNENLDYELLSRYVNSKTPMRFRHMTCGTSFEKMPELFLIGVRCPKCGLDKRSGVNHYRYDPSLTSEDRARRDMFTSKIRKWRNEVYMRDDYACKICDKHGGRLNAHHMNSWDTYENQRFDVNNGITLCEKCHRKFHSQYGYGDNSKQQFKEYLESI